MGLYIPIVVSTLGHLAEKIYPLIEVWEGVLAIAVWTIEETVRGDKDLNLTRFTQQAVTFGGHIS